jgi:preprotein translocase subunit SecA
MHDTGTINAPSEFQRRFYEKGTEAPLKGLDLLSKSLAGVWARRTSLLQKWQSKVDAALILTAELAQLSDRAFNEHVAHRCEQTQVEGAVHANPSVEDLALVCEVARRSIGLTPYPVQMLAALALCQGYLTEIDTGEGKTLSLAMAASLAAMGGGHCHIVTANDYLAARDAQTMRPVYQRLGVSVGVVVSETKPQDRGAAYLKRVVYTTAKEVAADYLRDRIFLGANDCSGSRYTAKRISGGRHNYAGMTQRGLFRAFIDEADNGLIDEATTPLIISRQQDVADLDAACRGAWAVAQDLVEGVDYWVWRKEHRLEFIGQGLDAAFERGGFPDSPLWACPSRRRQLVRLGLEAREFFQLGTQYIIERQYIGTSTSPIVIVDESTGRPMPNRSWKLGLHQMVEAKEGLPLSPPTMTIAQISFQSYFCKYGHLAGATGTAREIAAEVWQTYELATLRIPRNKPKQVEHEGTFFFRTLGDKEDAILAEIQDRKSKGQPVLVGTRSVTASERLARRLAAIGFTCEVLNATRLAEEADIVKMAGQRGHVTIATNMAGRGTDIKLGAGVEALGGLHVIATEPHGSRRIERQLFGRAARQGARGSVSAYYSFEDEFWASHMAARLVRWLGKLSDVRSLRPVTTPLNVMCLYLAQKRAERIARYMRKQVAENEQTLRGSLGFSK